MDDAPPMIVEKPMALKEVQLLLGVPQHVLIHLCEKGVVEPDFADTSGRGNRRSFSSRNLFEFALALVLRRFELPVATTGLIVRVLRSFLRALGKRVPALDAPRALVQAQAGVSLVLYDGDWLVLVAEGVGLTRPLLLGARIGAALSGAATLPRVVKLDALPERFEARLEIDLCEIARKSLK